MKWQNILKKKSVDENYNKELLRYNNPEKELFISTIDKFNTINDKTTKADLLWAINN